MDRYGIIIYDELQQTQYDEIERVLLNKYDVDNRLTQIKKPLFAALCLTCQQIQQPSESRRSPRQHKNDKSFNNWRRLDPSSFRTCLDEVASQHSTCQESGNPWEPDKIETAAEQLLTLATSLPPAGAYVDVCWVLNKDVPQLREALSLFGALKRLADWNQAVVTMVTPYTNSAMVTEWADALDALVPCPSSMIDKVIWQGSIHISGSQTTKTLYLPGYQLIGHDVINQGLGFTPQTEDVSDADSNSNKQTDQHILDRSLKFVSAIRKSHVPPFLLTDQVFELKLPSTGALLGKSRKLLHKLQDDRELCYLMSLKSGRKYRLIDRSEGKKNKQEEKKGEGQDPDWVEFIKGSSAVNPAETRLMGNVDQFHFLVCCEDDLERGPLTLAYLFRPPKTLNGSLGHELALQELQNKMAACDEKEVLTPLIKEVLDTLPLFTAEQLITLESGLHSVQFDILKSWTDTQKKAGKEARMSATELVSILSESRKRYMKKVLKKFKHNMEYFLTGADRPLNQLLSVTPECEMATFDQLERLCLVQRQAEAERDEQDRGVAGLSPPTKSQVVPVEVAEFLKCFKPDGTAADQTEMEPLITRSEEGSLPVARFDGGDIVAKTLLWPEVCSYKYFDIHYNLTAQCQKSQDACNRLQTKLHPVETDSLYRSQPHCLRRQSTGGKGQRPEVKKVRGEKRKADDQLVKDSTKILKARKKKQEQITKENALPKSHANIKEAAKPVPKSTEQKPVIFTKPKPEVTLKVSSQGQEVTKLEDKDNRRSSTGESRSQRHKRKLEEVVRNTLEKNEVKSTDEIFNNCLKRLYEISKSYVKDLTTSRHLKQEMEDIASNHVGHVISFEKSRLKRSKDETNSTKRTKTKSS